MPKALDIADWILACRAQNWGVPLTLRELHALLYYTQAVALAQRGQPLFDEPLIAGAHGPEVAEITAAWDGPGPLAPQRPAPALAEAGLIEDVMRALAGLTPVQLVLAPREEDPWREACGGPGLITTAALHRWLTDLLADGREVMERQGMAEAKADPAWLPFLTAGLCIRGRTRHPLYDWRLALILGQKGGLLDLLDDPYGPFSSPFD